MRKQTGVEMMKATTVLYFISGLLAAIGFALIAVGFHFGTVNEQYFGGFYVTAGALLLIWTKYLDGRRRSTADK